MKQLSPYCSCSTTLSLILTVTWLSFFFSCTENTVAVQKDSLIYHFQDHGIINDTIGKLAAPPATQLNVYFGDIHSHTNFSDGKGSPEDAFRYVRDSAHLDFFGLSDHDWGISNNEWHVSATIADRFNEDHSFITLRGFEWSSMAYGHINIFGTDEFCTSKEGTKTGTISGMLSWLEQNNGIAILNHPGRIKLQNEFDRFTGQPSDRVVGIELWNGASSFYTYFFNDGFYKNDRNRGFFDEALIRGWKIGAAGGGDNHCGTWGTYNDFRIAILAPALTRPNIMTSLTKRRFYSTADKNLRLSFLVDDCPMGSTISGGVHSISVTATDDDNETFSELFLLNSRHDTITIWNGEKTYLSVEIGYLSKKKDYLYTIVRQTDGDEAISSPIWIEDNDDIRSD